VSWGEGLQQDVARVADRLAAATPAWFAGRPHGAGSRAEVLRALVADLAALGCAAGTGQPAGAVVPVLGDHALADQLLVLTAELLAAPRARDCEQRARVAVRTARDAL
jgi:hypothetical protein